MKWKCNVKSHQKSSLQKDAKVIDDLLNLNHSNLHVYLAGQYDILGRSIYPSPKVRSLHFASKFRNRMDFRSEFETSIQSPERLIFRLDSCLVQKGTIIAVCEDMYSGELESEDEVQVVRGPGTATMDSWDTSTQFAHFSRKPPTPSYKFLAQARQLASLHQPWFFVATEA
jgi:hypothetical protein